MFTVTSTLGRVARTIGLLALVAALFSGFALTSASASASTRGSVGTLGVHVTATGGATIQSAVVRIYDPKGTNLAKAETDANGNAAFKIVPGTYKVAITAANYQATSTAGDVVAGEVTILNVALQSSNAALGSVAPRDGAVVAQVNSANGANVGQAAIYLFDAKGVAVAKGETNATGAVTISAPAGTYTVLVKAAGYQSWQPTTLVAVQGGQATKLSVTLQPDAGPDTK